MKEPIVSICVVTYNSSKTVLATLESIKFQSYKNIELIVSDDCSTDDTVEVACYWLEQNNSRFTRTNIVVAEKNTGVTGNANRGCKVATGEYVKIIAGDDTLFPNYVQECVEYLSIHSEILVLFTKVRFADEYGCEVIRDDVNYGYFALSASEQFNYILDYGVPSIPTPSVMYKKEIFSKVGYFDERIPMWEDGPMYYTLTRNNIKLYLLDKVLLVNGVLSSSLSNSVPFRHRQSIALFFFYDILKYEIRRKPIKATWHCLKFFLMYYSNKSICKMLLVFLENRKSR